MLVSEEWLRSWIKTDKDIKQIAYDLTQIGLEVEEIIQSDISHLNNVVSAEITKATKHPNADRLKLCEVTDGSKQYQIVCGAANARQGLKVALARVGTSLPGNFKIKESKIRDVVSQGMLCSTKELALGEDHAGIMELAADVPLGVKLSDKAVGIDLPATSIDLAITPNRGDCLGILGVARDLAALYDTPISKPKIEKVSPEHKDELPIELAMPQGCPLYLGRIIKGVDIATKVPDWMKNRLIASGLQTINVAVDITNYVMMELGQPLHAFDLRQIAGGIKVRPAADKEKLTLLDSSGLNLDKDDMLIADHQKALALAGVMGGKHSGIADDTKDVFLEGAFFTPQQIFGKQQKFNLSTDAAHRYERHVDHRLCFAAMERATQLFVEIAGGSPGPLTQAVDYKHLPEQQEIEISRGYIAEFLGFNIDATGKETKRARQDKEQAYSISDDKITKIFKALFDVPASSADLLNDFKDSFASNSKGNGESSVSYQAAAERSQADNATWKIKLPSYRPDIDCAEALCEELARIDGYDRVPVRLPTGVSAPSLSNQSNLSGQNQQDKIRDYLAARGFTEVINYSFINEDEAAKIYPGMSKLLLDNPISSDMGVMRPGLLAGVLQSLVFNQRRQQTKSRVKLFEIGSSFFYDEAAKQIKEHNTLALAISQNQQTRLKEVRDYNFGWLREDIGAVISTLGLANNKRLEFRYDFKDEICYDLFHPHQYFTLCLKGMDKGGIIGYGGILHPKAATDYKLPSATYLFEISLDKLPSASVASYNDFSRKPPAYLELSLVTAESLGYAELEQHIRKAAGRKLAEIKLFDVYQSAEMKSQQNKSFNVYLVWESAAETLTDQEVNKLMEEMLAKLTKHKISLRS